MANFTPGKWEVHARFDCHVYIKSGDLIVAQTECVRHENAAPREQILPNANVIAAAPEMYGALEIAKRNLMGISATAFKGHQQLKEQALDAIDAALAKADGDAR